MELLSPLRLLARRPLLIAFGALLAVAMGVAASGYVAVGPLGSPETRSAIATADIQIDTPRPLAADIRARASTIADQAILLAERLSADDTRALIAERAGVPIRDLAVLSSRTAIVGRPSALARSAVDAASSTQSKYRVTVNSTPDAPIISVVAAAPDRLTAGRLAAATAPAIELVIDSAPDTVVKRLGVKPLAHPETAVVVAGGPKPLLGAVALLFGFFGWCWFVVVAGGVIRVWRTGTTDPVPARAW